MMRHLAFIGALAASNDEDDSARLARAGLLVLRLADAWPTDPAAEGIGDRRAFTATKAAIEQLAQESELRRIMMSTVDSLVTESADSQTVWQHLMAFGRALDLDARWALAVDVYDTIIEHVAFDDDSHTLINALLRRGSCLRDLGRFTDAEACYVIATEQARRCGDVRGELRADIGRSKLAFVKGNLPFADAILAETIRSATEHSIPHVRSLANHERSSIAFARGDHAVAVRFAYAALSEYEGDAERDRILNDLASAFHGLGVRSAVRDVFRILAATASEQIQRWVSTINLMEMAATDGHRGQFERYRRQLAGAPLPPHLRVEFELHVGRCFQQWGEFDTAREWLDRAHHTAVTYALNRQLFAIEQALALNVPAPGQARARAEASIPLDIERIADELRVLRELTLATSE